MLLTDGNGGEARQLAGVPERPGASWSLLERPETLGMLLTDGNGGEARQSEAFPKLLFLMLLSLLLL